MEEEKSFRRRLFTAQGAIVLIVVLGVATGVAALRYIVGRHRHAHDALALSDTIHRVELSTQRLARATRHRILDRNTVDRTRIAELTAQLALARSQLNATARDSGVDVSVLDSRLDDYAMVVQRIDAARPDPDRDSLLRVDDELTDVRRALSELGDRIAHDTSRDAATDFERAERVAGRARWTLLFIGVLAIVLAVGVARVIVNEIDRIARRARDAVGSAQRLNDAKTRLATDSRELENALETVRASTRALAAATIRAPSEVKELATIADAACRIQERLDHLFDATGTLSMRSEPCEAGALVKDAVVARSATAIDRAVRLRCESPPAVALHADRERIGRVLTTLIDTAICAAPPGTEIVAGAIATDNEVRFSVSGPMGEPARGRPAELATFRRLIEAHGGRIGVEIAADTATHWFTLPTGPRLLR